MGVGFSFPNCIHLQADPSSLQQARKWLYTQTAATMRQSRKHIFSTTTHSISATSAPPDQVRPF